MLTSTLLSQTFTYCRDVTATTDNTSTYISLASLSQPRPVREDSREKSALTTARDICPENSKLTCSVYHTDFVLLECFIAPLMKYIFKLIFSQNAFILLLCVRFHNKMSAFFHTTFLRCRVSKTWDLRFRNTSKLSNIVLRTSSSDPCSVLSPFSGLNESHGHDE